MDPPLSSWLLHLRHGSWSALPWHRLFTADGGRGVLGGWLSARGARYRRTVPVCATQLRPQIVRRPDRRPAAGDYFLRSRHRPFGGRIISGQQPLPWFGRPPSHRGLLGECHVMSAVAGRQCSSRPAPREGDAIACSVFRVYSMFCVVAVTDMHVEELGVARTGHCHGAVGRHPSVH